MNARRRMAGTVAVSISLAVALSACNSQSVATRSSPGISPSASASPAVTAQGVMVLVSQGDYVPSENQYRMTISLVDAKGHVVNSASFGLGVPYMTGCAAILPPQVRVAAGAVYFGGGGNTGVINRLGLTGYPTQVGHLPPGTTNFTSWAVRPDGQGFIAILLNTPTPIYPLRAFPADPYVASSHWRLDMYNEVVDGYAVPALHREFGHTYPSPGPTLVAGWDDAGPVATLDSQLCVHSPPPSVEYMGAQLIHLGADGTHLDTIGGAGCIPWDELPDGTVLCGGSDRTSFSVRSRDGKALWSRKVAGPILEPKLSPDGNAVLVNGVQVNVYLRDGGQMASVARQAGQSVRLLGWFGKDYVVALRDGTALGLVPVVDPATFIDLGPQAIKLSTGAPAPMYLAGTLGA